MGRVLVIGIDSATFDLIDSLVAAGRLPCLAQLMKSGTRAVLRSVIPPLSPQAWASFATGQNPGRHGIFGFKEKLEGSYGFQFVNNRTIKSKTLWRLLSEANKRVTVVNIPMTYPPEPVEGILISGMDAPGLGSEFTYPPEVKHEIRRAVPDYFVHLHVAGYLDTDRKRRRAAGDLRHMVEVRERLVLHLLRRDDWDFFCVNFAAIDQAQHHFWRYMGQGGEFGAIIEDLYAQLDAVVGRLLSACAPGTTVFIMSDHGAGPISEVTLFIDEWLRAEGLAAFLKGEGRARARTLLRGAAEYGAGLAMRRLSSSAKDLVQRLFPRLRARTRAFVNQAVVDWKKTRIYSGENIGTLRANVAGREPEGVLELAEVDGLLGEVSEKLMALMSPVEGEPLVERVCRRNDLYWGEYAARAPELTIWTKDNYYRVQKKIFRGDKPRAPVGVKKRLGVETSGTHRVEGIFLASGPGIRSGAVVSPQNIYDLFPTVMYALGLEAPSAVDGRVIEEAYTAEHLQVRPVRLADYDLSRRGGLGLTYGRDEAKDIEDHLRGLGYLE